MIFPTPPLQIIDLPADTNHTGKLRALSQIRAIVLHSTEGLDSRAWLTRTSSPPVSIHRLIRRLPGEHYKILPDTRVAWHAGGGKWGNYLINDVTLGVELERKGTQTYTEYQMDEVSSLVCEWWGLYGFIPVMGHGQLDPWRRSDPVAFNWRDFWSRCVAKIQAAGVVR